ncbi:octopamine receptor-like [Actinia tenebrosa]|uniref:Octopamine receptor-like n=1 Tax=Actinia tenebrosa TaxID=6105 RepID=A0A6P8IZ02_ACTTE|nr:octopamine receptor-like [Actinia tenebrosa]XP_031572741.1 octopamine receptor-like [Actinia tenebrosa]
MNSLYNATARNCTSVGNGTSCGVGNSLSPWYYSSFNVTLVVLYSLIIFAALMGNILVCLAVCINSNLRQNVSSYFIVSLAISDIGTTCLSMTFDLEQFTTHGKWYHGETMCVIWTTAYLITVPSSIWNLFVLSIDRYKTLKNPWKRYKESHSMTTKRAIITIAILWIYCFAFALLPVMGWKAYPRSVKNNYCWFNISLNFSIVGSAFNFYLPMFAMCYIYYKVYQIARAHIKFPLALKTRYDQATGSGNASGVSTVNTLESPRRTSAKQYPNVDPTNQETATREVMGLENVSFYFEENLANKSLRPEKEPTGKENKSANEKFDAIRVNPLGKVDINDINVGFSNKPRITNQCINTRTDDLVSTKNNDDLRKYRYGLKRCDSVDNDIQQLDSETKTRAENRNVKDRSGDNKPGFSSDELTSSLSTREAVMRESVEKDERAIIKKSSKEIIPQSSTVLHPSNLDSEMEKVKAGLTESKKENKDRSSQENFTEKSQLKTSISLNSFKRFYDPSSRLDNKCIKSKPTVSSSTSDNSLCKRKTKLPFAKPLNKKSEAINDDESCSLRKFHKRSIENQDEFIESRRESSSESKGCPPPPGEFKGTFKRQRDSLTHSNQRRLKHLTKNTKAARTISIIVGTFLICWIPFTTMSIAFNICSVPCYTLIPSEVFSILLWLGYLNSALNPVLFSYRNMQFRKSYRKIASKVLPCLKKQ